MISSLHFTTFVNISQKLRYFEGRNYIQIGYKSYSVLLFSPQTYERWDILDFQKGENLIKVGYDPLTNYVTRKCCLLSLMFLTVELLLHYRTKVLSFLFFVCSLLKMKDEQYEQQFSEDPSIFIGNEMEDGNMSFSMKRKGQ